MRILHTSDWHLGKSLMEHPLIEDQKHFISQLEELLAEADKDNPFDALIIAGDIYDRAIPPAEAVTLFSGFLSDLHKKLPDLKIILSAGNHDSPERLSYAKELLVTDNIYFATDCSCFTQGIEITDHKTGSTSAVIYNLPFLTPGCIAAENEDLFAEKFRTQQELLEAAVTQIEKSHKEKYPDLSAICSAHLFTSEAVSESNKSSVGEADVVDSSLFNFFTYTALGHIHSCYKAGKCCAWYSGSPLSYTFGEKSNSKYFLDVNIAQDNSVTVNRIPVEPLHKCTVLKDTWNNLSDETMHEENREDYICAVCTDTTPVLNPMALLRSKFPNILAFSYESVLDDNESQAFEKRKAAVEDSEGSPEKMLHAFLEEMYGDGMDRQTMESACLLYRTEFEELTRKGDVQ